MRQSPRGGADSGTATAGGRLVSIGSVLNQLRDEFPEVTISKIRFLESEGLVEPQRTPSGYRKFSPDDVRRLAQVLRMQRDHYLPLRVIKEHLDAAERGEEVQLPSVGPQRGPGDAADDLTEVAVHAAALVERAEFLAAAEVGEEQLDEWESYGLITPVADGGYDIEAVQVARLISQLGDFGIEPRHLRAMRASAEREAGLVEQVVAPLRRHRNPQTRAHAEARTKELAGLTVRLHSALVQTALRVRLH